MGKRIGLIAIIAFAGFGLALGAAGTAAAPQTVALDTCSTSAAQTAVVTPGGEVALTGPTFLGTNFGSIQDFLNGATTTFTLNGEVSTVGTYSAPAAVADAALGEAWATTWSASVPAPAVGAPERLSLQIVLQHPMPQLRAPASDGNLGFGAGATFTRQCVLSGGQPVTAAGGTVVTADRAVTLVIPSGALSTTTPITIDPSTVTPPAAIGTAVGTVYDFGPAGTTFSVPAPLSLSYDPAAVPATAVASLHIAGLSNGVWRLHPSTVDPVAHAVTAPITHFSSYAIVRATCSGFIVGGTVTAGGTTPIVGVQVQEITGSIAAPAATDLTDLNGEYALCVPNLTTLKLRFEPPTGSAYASQWYNGSTIVGGATAIFVASADVVANAALGPGTAVTGVVTDRATGLPLAGAFVTIHKLTATGTCCSFDQTLVERTTSDATGRYHAALPNGTYKLVSFPAAGANYVTQWWRDASTSNGATGLVVPSADAAADVSFALVPGYRVTGTVTDTAATALPNASVQALGTDAFGNPAFVAGGGTDSAGQYSFVVPAGTFKVRFNPPQNSAYLGQWWNAKASFAAADPLTVSATQPPPAGGVNAALVTGVLFSGRVTNVAAAGVAGVNVQFFQAPDANGNPGQFQGGTQTGSDGSFSVAMPAGVYSISIRPQVVAPYYAMQWWNSTGGALISQNAQVLTVDSTHPAPTINATLQSGFLVTGRITDTGGVPVPGALANANIPFGPKGCCGFVNGGQVDGNGNYAFVLGAGSYYFNFMVKSPSSPYLQQWWQNKPDFQHADAIVIDATHNASPFNAQLVRGVRISGQVVAAGTTTGIPGVQVGLAIAPSTPNACCVGAGGARTDGNGAFSMLVAPSTAYVLNYGGAQSSYVFRWYDGVVGTRDVSLATVLTPTADVSGLQLQAALGYRISGHVSQPGGASAPNVNVQAGPVSGSGGGCAGGCGRTDNTGSFDFAIEPGSSWIVRFDPQGTNQQLGTAYAAQYWNASPTPSGAAPINAVAGGALGNMNVTLAVGATITGRVTDTAGTGLGGVGVGANDAAVPCCTGLGFAQTDSLGYYTLHIAPGVTVKIGFFPSQPYRGAWYNGASDFVTATPITTSAGATVPNVNAQLVRQVAMSGSVTAGGLPAAGVRVELLHASTTFCCQGFGNAQTDANGNYTVYVDPGIYKVRFTAPAGSRATGQWWNGTRAGSYGVSGAVDVNLSTDQPGIGADLTLGYFISGHVTGPGGPLGNVWVNVSPPVCCGGNDLLATGTNTAADGSYQLVVRGGSSYKLQFNPQPQTNLLWQFWNGTVGGTRAFDQATTITVGGTDIAPYDAQLQPGVHLTGTVYGPTGVLGGVNVSAQSGGTAPCCTFSNGARTQPDGSYDLLVPAGLPFRIQFDTSGTAYLPQWYSGASSFSTATDVVGPASGLDAHLVLGSVFSGRVTDALGRGLANVWVGANIVETTCCHPPVNGAPTDGTGTFSFAVPTGQYRLWVDGSRAGFLSGWYDGTGHTVASYTAGATLGAPPDHTGLVIALTSGFTISGQVVTSLGAAIPNAEVSVSGLPFGSGINAYTNSDSAGRWSVVVPAGQYALHVLGPRSGTPYVGHWYGNSGSDPATAAPITRTSQASTPPDPIVMTLQDGVRIHGHVSGTGGVPVSNVGVVAYDATQPCCFHAAAWGSDYIGGGTDANGDWSLVVPVGSYKLVFYPGCCGAPTSPYAMQYWSDKLTFATADVLAVPSAAASGSVDIVLHAASPTWTSAAHTLLARSNAAGVSDGRYVYVIGGNDGTRDTADLQRYDPATNSWSLLAPLPAGRYSGDGAVVLNGKIYLPGGWTTSPPLPWSTLFIYDIATNVWSTGAAMPSLSACGNTVVLGGKLYVMTPCNGYAGYTAYLYAYDPLTNAWTGLPSSPHVHSSGVAAAMNGKIYLAGGFDGSASATWLDIYDPLTNSWSAGAPMPSPQDGGVSGVIGGRLYVAGGQNGPTNVATVVSYDPLSNSWRSELAMPTATGGAAGAVLNGTLYVAGGNQNGLLTTATEVFTP